MGPVKSVLSAVTGTAKAPDVPIGTTAVETPVPTIDDTRADADAAVAKDRRRGRLANYLTPSSTAAQLGGSANTPSSFVKSLLGS